MNYHLCTKLYFKRCLKYKRLKRINYGKDYWTD